MTKTDGGQEQELVLGNKQLLSAFFIVVALLGVFFTMGYIIGRNTGKETAASSDATAAVSKPLEIPAEKPPESVAPEPPPSPEPVAQPAKPYEEEKPAGAVPTSKALEEKPREEPVAPVPQKKPEPRVPQGSHYLQVMAVKRPDAEKVQKILHGHGFPVSLKESSKEGLYRVLVGPYEDRPALSKAKDELKSAGFDSIVAR